MDTTLPTLHPPTPPVIIDFSLSELLLNPKFQRQLNHFKIAMYYMCNPTITPTEKQLNFNAVQKLLTVMVQEGNSIRRELIQSKTISDLEAYDRLQLELGNLPED